MSVMRSAIRRSVRSDSGVVMVAVIGVIAFVTVVAIAAFVLAQQSLTESTRIERESLAFQAADAGLEAALADIMASGFSESDYPMEKNLAGGSYIVTVEDLENSEFKATSVGTSPDGTTETLVNRFFFMNIWEMTLALGDEQSIAAGSGGMMGSSFFWGPLYVRGTLAMGNVDIMRGPLFVWEGDIVKASGSPQIGEPDEPVDIYVTGIIGSGVTVYAGNISPSVPDIAVPKVPDDYAAIMWYKSQDESVDNIMGTPAFSSTTNTETGGTPDSYEDALSPFVRVKAPNASSAYKCIAPEGGASPLKFGSTALTIGGTGSWGAWEGNGYGIASGLHDDFAFDDVNKILYIEGTVFVDGPLTFNGDIEYVGNGTIFANGDITINDTLRANTPSKYVNEGHAIGLVTPLNITFGGSGANPRPPNDEPDFSGAFFAQGITYFTVNTYLKGSIIAGGMDFAHPNSHLETDPNLPSFLPDSLPGAGAFFLVRGIWTR